jgi:hypothetical protein
MIDPVVIPFCLLPILFADFIVFDVLVRRLHNRHPDDWKAAGEPVGIFWRPEQKRWISFRQDMATKRAMFGWLFVTPRWIRSEEPSSTALLWVVRVTTFVWNAGIIIMAILMAKSY